MSLVRGKFGIEYTPEPRDDDSSSVGWIVLVLLVAALTLLTVTLYRRLFPPDEDFGRAPGETTAAESPADAGAPPDAAPRAAQPPALKPERARNRPQIVQNLLLKLEKSEQSGDIDLTVATIEQLRSLPGEAVADLDDSLARRLGDLNVRRLLVNRSRQWTEDVTVKRGDSASRIAAEHGSTLASLLKLNPELSPDRLRVGQKLVVMNHPMFTLVIHRAMKVADLSLNKRFFKRYDLTADVLTPAGRYESSANLRAFFAEKGLGFSAADHAELETLLPARTPVLISDL